MSILFLIPYPQEVAPSQRFRFEQYLQLLIKAGYHIKIRPFFRSSLWLGFESKNALSKSIVVFISIVNRLADIFKIYKYQYVFIHRESAPFGPPIFEWIVAKVFRKKIIYDFDDAIWLTDNQDESHIVKFIRWRSKIANICKWSFKISCGNQYLYNYAIKFNKNVIINPTTIDTESHHVPNLNSRLTSKQVPIIGWTGSSSTLKYLNSLDGVLSKIHNKNKVKILVIADQKPELSFPFEFVPWTSVTEIESLKKIDIGVMPLADDSWTNGKCGFKALQYMAMQIPCIVSPVGVNKKIIDHGKNGFLANSDEEWIDYLTMLIKDYKLRYKLGINGRLKVLEDYSTESNASNFLSLFE